VRRRRIDFIRLTGLAGALLFIVCLYTSPSQLVPAVAVLRPAMLAAGIMFMGLLLQRLFHGEQVQFAGGIGAAMCALFAFAAMSALWAMDPDQTKSFTADAIKEAFAFVGFVSVLHTRRHIRLALLTGALCSIVPGYGTIDRYRNGIGLVEGFRGNWIGLLENPNQLAMVMAVTVPWALYMLTRTRGVLRPLLLAAMGLEAGAIVATHSRGGALGLAASLLAYALLAERKARALLMVLVATAGIAVLAPSTFWARTETIQDYAMDASAMGRIKSWQTGFQAFEESPILGVGANNYQLSWNRFTPRNVRERAYTAHNMWMQVMVELGLVGLGAFATMFFLIVRGLWRARRSEAFGGEARTLLASLVALVVCGTTGGYAFNWFFYMVLGIAGAVIVRSRQHEATLVAPEREDASTLAVA
jgi:putative inorganic carbon (HCO3(-)) transporter